VAELTGRRAECGVLGRLVASVRAGESRALVVYGEPGVGKTALLEYLAGQASGCRVVRAVGIQSEMELAFAALHQLCTPMLDRLDRLPAPQRDALRTALGLSAGLAPDRFLIGLAALGLLSEVAGDRPLVCIVDDEQWLDSASAQVLAFVGRRLGAESVGLVFGARVPTGDLAGLPELVVGGLQEDDARALLDSALTGPLDARVRDQPRSPKLRTTLRHAVLDRLHRAGDRPAWPSTWDAGWRRHVRAPPPGLGRPGRGPPGSRHRPGRTPRCRSPATAVADAGS
jgi:hypothetical protein